MANRSRSEQQRSGRAKGDDRRRERDRAVRYGVVGLGWFAQTAVLPAFEHARRNSRLVALLSTDGDKLDELGRRYEVELTADTDELESVVSEARLDALYVAVPNDHHREFVERAAAASVHVLCEKPMAVTVRDCEAMIEATEEANVRLMIAYRLHFEEANMRAMEVVRSGKIGEPRFFVSSFSNRVDEPDNIRLGPLSEGGGTLYDIGIYCINAARYLFRDEPVEVTALASMGNGRFADCDEMTSAILRFSDDRLATFTTSFAAADHDYYQVFGTEGNLLVRPAFGSHDGVGHILEIGDNTRMEHFQCRDQVAAELLHFSDAILEGHAPEPSGDEGLADVTIIEALLESASSGRSVEVKPRLLSASTARRDRRGHPSSRSVPVRAR